MYSNVKKKREDFANQIRSEQRKAYFERERKKLKLALQDGDVDQEEQIMATLIDLLGSQAQVHQMLKMYDQYERSRQEYEKKIQQDEEASINFQRMQDMKKREEDKEKLLELFKQLEEQENQQEQYKDVEI